MKKVAITEGASELGQKIASQYLTQNWDVLCIDDLSQYPSPQSARLLKRDVSEVGPLEMALKKEKTDLLIFIPRLFLSGETLLTQQEFHVNSLLGFLKVAERIEAPEFLFVLRPELPRASRESCLESLSQVRLKSPTVLTISEKFLK
jgi:hypothetical protein